MVLAALLALGTGISAASSWSWISQGGHGLGHETVNNPNDGSVRERINPDGTCDLVDANGVPLYDSQFTERTGSSPCDQN